jgi:hypothetical protein
VYEIKKGLPFLVSPSDYNIFCLQTTRSRPTNWKDDDDHDVRNFFSFFYFISAMIMIICKEEASEINKLSICLHKNPCKDASKGR